MPEGQAVLEGSGGHPPTEAPSSRPQSRPQLRSDLRCPRRCDLLVPSPIYRGNSWYHRGHYLLNMDLLVRPVENEMTPSTQYIWVSWWHLVQTSNRISLFFRVDDNFEYLNG